MTVSKGRVLPGGNSVILPCPFCGSGELQFTAHKKGPGDIMESDAYWQCMTCTTTGPNGIDAESATIQWNTRHHRGRIYAG